MVAVGLSWEKRLRTLVGILRCGENEFEQCISSLKNQTYRNYDYFVIENQPNKAAHDQLYQRFMDSASNYDAFLKLDADMVFANERALEQLCDQVELDTSILFSWVNDIPSSLKIPGIFMFRSNVVWTGNSDNLNVDYAPQFTGRRKAIGDRDLVLHMPDPSPLQLLRYGVHKALKAIQPDRRKKIPKKGLLHIAIINGIARNYSSGRKDLAPALIGAMLVFSGRTRSVDYNSDTNRALFEEILSDEVLFEQMRIEAGKYWSAEVNNLFRWFDAHQSTVWT